MEKKPGDKIRVLVVDDSAFVRRALIRMFEMHSEIRIIDVAADGVMALDLVKKLQPDVVTLDVKMPVLDGLSALSKIMNECPTPVIMLSSLTERGGENTLKALELGAVDFIDKTSAGGPMDISALAGELTAKILIAARVDVNKLKGKRQETAVSMPLPVMTARGGTELVLIGTSTGGPQALQHVLSKIPESFPCPILVVQHMPIGFTASLAERLNRICAINVKEALDGEPIQQGYVYIAPAGTHLKITRHGPGLQVKLDPAPENALHRPSVDALLESAAEICGKNAIAFILTGMGKDGSSGAKAIKKAGGKVYVESEETSIVHGMPKAAMDSVQVDGAIPLYEVADVIMKTV
jgi:two-component system, chemotaxis family, protein-glutamate methylesterase/glutaminase